METLYPTCKTNTIINFYLKNEMHLQEFYKDAFIPKLKTMSSPFCACVCFVYIFCFEPYMKFGLLVFPVFVKFEHNLNRSALCLCSSLSVSTFKGQMQAIYSETRFNQSRSVRAISALAIAKRSL